MNIEEVKDLMSEHLKDLKKTAEECDEKFLAPITEAMISTVGIIVALNKATQSDNE